MQETGRNYTKKALNILKLQCLLENIKAADPNLGVGHTITEKLYKKLQDRNAEGGVCYNQPQYSESSHNKTYTFKEVRSLERYKPM